jgi:SAM-dependent methyltransferase
VSLEQSLLVELLAENPFQPATSWWRSIELAVIIRHGMPEGRGLDLGCGDGKLMRILLAAHRANRELVGVDLDPLETRDALTSGVYARVHTAPGERIPEPDRSFDFAFSNSVLEHIDAIDPVIAEVARLLHPGARFVFTVPGAHFHDCLRGPLAPWAQRTRYLETVDRRCAHRRYWSAAQWGECLARHGMQVTAAREYLSEAQTRRWETLSRFTSGVLFSLMGERVHPIEIQRRLRLRKRALSLPRWLAQAVAAATAAGRGASASGQRFACLLVEARRS